MIKLFGSNEETGMNRGGFYARRGRQILCGSTGAGQSFCFGRVQVISNLIENRLSTASLSQDKQYFTFSFHNISESISETYIRNINPTKIRGQYVLCFLYCHSIPPVHVEPIDHLLKRRDILHLF